MENRSEIDAYILRCPSHIYARGMGRRIVGGVSAEGFLPFPDHHFVIMPCQINGGDQAGHAAAVDGDIFLLLSHGRLLHAVAHPSKNHTKHDFTVVRLCLSRSIRGRMVVDEARRVREMGGKMKKSIIIAMVLFLVVFAAAALFSGCGGNTAQEQTTEAQGDQITPNNQVETSVFTLQELAKYDGKDG